MMASSAASNGAESSRARKSSTTTTTATTAALHPPEHDLKCPRCDSPNTKFCYYNNYSLTQPRHFCKTCRRYWTKGGALRNVPVGGGCRKNKKSKSSASAPSSSPSSSRIHLDPFDPITGLPEPSYGGGLKFLAGLSPAPAAVDFQLGMLPFSKLHTSTAPGVLSSNQFIPFGDYSPAAVSTSMVGFNHPLSSTLGVYSEMGGSSAAVNNTAHSSLASSIESLSSINQDLHWKLQQQRLAVYFGEAGAQRESRTVSAVPSTLMDDPQEPISFQVAENSRADQVCGSDADSRAWFLGTSSYTVADTNTNIAANHNGINSTSDNTTNSWNGVAAWNDMHHFTALP